MCHTDLPPAPSLSYTDTLDAGVAEFPAAVELQHDNVAAESFRNGPFRGLMVWKLTKTNHGGRRSYLEPPSSQRTTPCVAPAAYCGA